MSNVSLAETPLPSLIVDSLKLIPEEIMDLPFSEIEKKAQPSIDLKRLRVAFWLEYDRASRTDTTFSMSNVYKGIMTSSGFKKHILGNSYRTLYLTASPPHYQVIMEEMLHYGLMLERDIMEMAHISEKGVDIELLKLKQKITDGVHNRLKGLPISRSLMLTQNISGESKESSRKDLKSIEAEIAELKKSVGEG